ncbi:flagellar brake protein [Castellaniella sp. S9]|uniref:flagellar brake protein n=1 Tax=Castellaniella sp. S9 TaxID=2993652 RepID=UPI0022B55BF7|nr:flagellar brake protein [Castellaniella sp. S9]
MHRRDDQYLVSQPLEIQSILNALRRKRTLVRLDVPDHATAVISTILDIEGASGDLYLDNAAAADVNTRLLAAPSVRFQATLDRILIEFHGTLSPTQWEDSPAFLMARPQSLYRLQRREFFRVEVPTKNPAVFTVLDPPMEGAKAVFPVHDISAGGLRLVDKDHLLGETVGKIYMGRLDMPGVQTIEVGLRVLRTAEITPESGKATQTVACKYFNLGTNKQIAIQQYIGQLERAMMARRWALE